MTIRKKEDTKYDAKIHHNEFPQDKQLNFNACEIRICIIPVDKPDKGIPIPVCESWSWSGKSLIKEFPFLLIITQPGEIGEHVILNVATKGKGKESGKKTIRPTQYSFQFLNFSFSGNVLILAKIKRQKK